MPSVRPVDYNPFEASPRALGYYQAQGERLQRVGDALAKTWPARLAKSAYDAVTLPGDVYAGRTTPNDKDYYNRATDLAGLVMGGSYAAPAVKGGAGMGIRAYHGSPHDFDRFDMSKIGTGEGAQAYGHGLYFAEKEGVAKSYRDTLSRSDGGISGIAQTLVDRAGGDWGEALAKFEADVNKTKELAAKSGLKYAVPAYDQQILDELRRGKPGRMYEVDIKANPDQFLDWDRPLNQQPNVEAVKAAVGDLWPDLQNANVRNIFDVAPDKMTATKSLRDAGIPGIKYLDAGSRAAGDGSRNYVVFDDSLIEILRKYGIAGISMLPPAVAAGLSVRPVNHDPWATQ
jgi:hypothetical protein